MEAYMTAYVTYMGFVLELFLAEILFSIRYRTRSYWIGRMTASILLQLLVAFGLSNLLVQIQVHQLWSHMVEIVLAYLVFLMLSLLGLHFCYQEKTQYLILCMVSGYAVQHLASQMKLMIVNFLDFNWRGWFIFSLKGVDILCLILLYRWIARRASEGENARLENRNITFLSVVTILLLLVLSSARDYYQQESVPLVTITRLFSIMCCIFLLLLRSGYLDKSHLEYEMETIQKINHKERAQYEQNRQNIELINIKCHDLRKRMEQYEDRIIGITEEERQEITQAISIYDTTVKTGNETLDTILTERSLICESKGIVFSCIADGSSLGFLSTGDLYSIFANALDNAMEAVSYLSNPSDRIISLSVRKRMGMVVINIDNYYDAAKLKFQNGLPLTTKHNQQYHGYGMKSIQLIVRKYDGEMAIHADDMFHLSILIPLPSWAKE